MRYESPATIKEAVGLLKKEKGKAYVLAGGTDVLVGMKMGHVEPDLLVDIKRIPGLGAIKASKTGFRIGAAVSCAELGENPAVLAHRYALAMDGVSTVVTGVKNRQEQSELVEGLAKGPLGPEIISKIDALRLNFYRPKIPMEV